MNLNKLKQLLKDEPRYRLKQINRAVMVDLIENWDEATILPKSLREKLKADCPLDIGVEMLASKSGKAKKAVVALEDGEKIETVLMSHGDGRMTACISSQVGCALDCSFCATGKMGFKRNLTQMEMVEQVLIWDRYLKKTEMGGRVSNVVLMGMGEPFLNYDNVMEAVKVINSPEGLGIGARKISISTAGIVPGIKKLAGSELQVNLAVSLHAPNEQLRTKLMPVNRVYPLGRVLKAVEEYVKQTNRKVMLEYLMIDRVNDDIKYARELVALLKSKPLVMVNLITYNQTGQYRPSSKGAMEVFKTVLEKGGISATRRYEFGHDIRAACGQLAGIEKRV